MTHKLTIAVDARPLAKAHDGISRVLWELVAELGQRPDLRLVLLTHVPPVDRPLPPGVELVWDRAYQRWPGSLWLLFRFARLARRHGAQLAWGPQHVLPPLGGMPGVITVHDLVHKRYPQTMAPYNRLISALLLGGAWRRAAALICISQFTRSELQHFHPELARERQHVIHNGITPLPAAEPTATPLPARFLFVLGSLEPRKNLAQLVRVFARVRAQQPDLHLVLAGGASWKDSEVWRTVTELGVEPYVHALGRITDGQIRHCMAACEAFVFSSIYEGFGLPPVEAAGIAPRVVMNDIPVLRELRPYLPEAVFVPMAQEQVSADLITQALQAAPQLAGEERRWAKVAADYVRVFTGVGSIAERAT